MKYFWLVPKNQRHNNFIFYHEANSSQPVTLRDRYHDLQCNRCKKIDELEALRRGLDDGITIRARNDYVSCDYGLIAVSARFRRILSEHNISGLKYAELLEDDNYAVLIPDILIETNVDTCCMEFHRPCDECGRPRETCSRPSVSSMNLPENTNAVVASSIFSECIHGSVFWFLAAMPIVDILKKNKISGVEYNTAY